MEERVGQAVASGKAEAEKAQKAGGTQVLWQSVWFCAPSSARGTQVVINRHLHAWHCHSFRKAL